jgi:O-antigen/teichoic acid export membrane protein
VSRIRELVGDSVIYGLSSVVARFLNYLLVPLYTGVFDPAAYGVVGLVYGAVVFLNVLFTLGLESAYIRHAADRDRAQDVFKTLQLLLVGAGLVFLVALHLAAPWVQGWMQLTGPEADRVYGWVLMMLLADALSVVPFAELRMAGRPYWFASLKSLNVIVNLALNLVLILHVGMGIEAVFISNAVASVVTGILVWLRTWPMMAGAWRTDMAAKALWFGLPYVPNGIGFAINEVLDRFWLSRMDPADILALYGEGVTAADVTGWYNACYKLGVFMLLLVQMFRMAWQPFFMKHAAEADASALFGRVFLVFTAGAGTVFLMVGLFAPEIAAIRIPGTDATVIGERYWTGLAVVPWVLAAYAFQGWFTVFSVGLFIQDRTKRLPMITGAGAVATILLNAVLVPAYGMVGAAMASTGSYAVMSLLLHMDTRRHYPVAYDWAPTFATVGVLALAVYAGSGESLWVRLLCVMVGMAAIAGLVARGLFRRDAGR